LKKACLYKLFLLLCLSSVAQQSRQLFLDAFAKANSTNKVKLVASKNFQEIAGVYPLIKDTLDRIKKTVYHNPQSGRLKFLFDKIDSDHEAYSGHYAKAIFILENSLRNHAADINDSLRCLVGLKKLFLKIRNYNKAIELHYLIELRKSKATDIPENELGAKKSSIYHQLGLTEKAIGERRKEYEKLAAKGDTNATVSYYNDMGVFFNVLKNSDSAKSYFLKAKYLLEHMQYPAINEVQINFFKALVDGNLGLAYYNNGKVREAVPLLQRDVYYSRKSNNFESAVNSYLLLVRSQLALGDKHLAELYLDTARILVTEDVTELAPKLKFILTQADYYNATGDFSRANENYRQYLGLSEKARIIENAQRLQNEKVSIGVEQREIELAERDKMLKQIQLNEARDRSFRAYLLAGTLVMLVIMCFLIYNNYSSKKREEQLSTKNKQISRQKFQIEQSLKDKDVLIKEIHHRVKNNLQIITSMLSLQISKIDDEKTESILRDAKQRISSIALTHQMLYQKENLSTVNLGEYLERLVRQIEHIMPLSNIELLTNISSQNSRLSIDNAVPLGLLVNELLTNAYKHAFPEVGRGRIRVSLTEDESSFTVEISDNGVGLPHNFDSQERKTLGMELIYILAEQLDSGLIIENANGSCFKLNVKKT
jgi:two-component sensor histidine kinase